jgi:DNA-binding CsgD family transcriptional regulator
VRVIGHREITTAAIGLDAGPRYRAIASGKCKSGKDGRITYQYRAPQWQRLRDFCRKYGFCNVLCTAVPEPAAGLLSFMSLVRSDDLDIFHARDREWHQLAMPHIAAALRVNREVSLRERARIESPVSGKFACVDNEGIVLSVLPGFIEQLRTEWPSFDGIHLPPPLRDPIQTKPRETIPVLTRLVACEIQPTYTGWIVAVVPRSKLDVLTGRERDVVLRYAEGHTYSQIATQLGLAPATVRRHLQRSYDRLDVHSKTDLLRLIG